MVYLHNKIIILLSLLIISQSNAQTIRFVAGIEKDLSAIKQCQIVKRSLPNKNVILYKKGEYAKLIKDSYMDTTSIIILFSAGAKDSYRVIESVLSDVWIIEPHFSYGENIRKCISIGFPKTHIVLGPYKERGFGISKGCIKTPNRLGHFGALEWACKKLSK